MAEDNPKWRSEKAREAIHNAAVLIAERIYRGKEFVEPATVEIEQDITDAFNAAFYPALGVGGPYFFDPNWFEVSGSILGSTVRAQSAEAPYEEIRLSHEEILAVIDARREEFRRRETEKDIRFPERTLGFNWITPPRVEHHIDVDFETARVLHRVVRAMHDGECPKCHALLASDHIYQYDSKRHACYRCGFFITDEESKAAIEAFAPVMDKNLAVFENWREDRKNVKRDD